MTHYTITLSERDAAFAITFFLIVGFVIGRLA